MLDWYWYWFCRHCTGKCTRGSYVKKQLVHVGVAGHLLLVFGHFIHLPVEVKLQAGQLLLHLPHMLHLTYGALVAWQQKAGQTHCYLLLPEDKQGCFWHVVFTARGPNYQMLVVSLSGSRWGDWAGRSPSPARLTHQSGRSAGWWGLPGPGSGSGWV